ncbi:valine--tRNA ligase [Methanoculleus sp. FWC-SCC1]|uniref:Valine--tRNA ligase n=1 Tax=Methanoculleus frigidifontis TaxID=2584085 RepID=A0ABT8M7Q2_9EURY|nr:valine--tRNA ligase [Methanoculleus sp. FWC-SCC1]MDN7023967.1 valine--tRNA ligase [Methanoculleus sp. FWC-SCC1]
MSSSHQIPKTYDFEEVESRWQGSWRDEDNYFNPASKKPRFIIDTPPPYPTGNFHIGNALNWCYIDFIARYRRMRGFNVMFPQGWDCHGLPTEVKVEETYGITKNDVPREEFRTMCRELTLGNIAKMRRTMRRLGFSVDWSNEYITMLPEYFGKTQRSFLQMLRAGDIYQSEHPVNFCTRCETAIAFAEVAYEPRTTKLNYFDFDGIEIATTRPELLAACVAVAVHPEDERYTAMTGRRLEVPLFGHAVPIIEDAAVDPAFGSGAVMICTFGDKMDVHWWKQHDLDLRKAIDRQGIMTDTAGRYAGMNAAGCREAILRDMEDAGILIRQEELEQRVGTCWRCKTPIEILSERQWFVKIHQDDILKAARAVRWTPEHMFTRMENWAGQMEWDWCISRQRIFATPIPVWFCRSCGEQVLPAEEDLPIDPTVDTPKEPCPRCGGTDFEGEEDVLDTWMDSSISVLNVTGWNGGTTPPALFPAQIRPQGHDIIRTWAFYTILRANALVGGHPWDEILVNGMVLGEDGFKMSKSRDNIISPEAIVSEYGADALRQWGAGGAATGSDIMFNWNDVVAASRFQTKLWNIVRFVLGRLEKDGGSEAAAVTEVADRWLLDRLSETVAEVTAAMEGYQFDRALRAIREFAWNTLADDYIELAKGRLYGDDEGRSSAASALRITIDALCRMLAPIIPHFAAECYYHLTGSDVHTRPWPEFSCVDAEARRQGDLVVQMVAELRRYKHDAGMALNAPLGQVKIYAPEPVDDAGDAGRALNADLRWSAETPDLEQYVSDVEFNMAVVGPALRKQAKAFMDAVRALPPEQLTNPPRAVSAGGEEIPVPENAFSPKMAYRVAGEEVDVLTVGDVIVTIGHTA